MIKCFGKHRIHKLMNSCGNILPDPIPPVVVLSWGPKVVILADCGATLGKYRQPNPSADMSNSTKEGKVQEP